MSWAGSKRNPITPGWALGLRPLLHDDEAHIVSWAGKPEEILPDCLVDLPRAPVLDASDDVLEAVWEIEVDSVRVLGQPVGVEQQNVAGPHQCPLVGLVVVLEP